MKLIVVGISAFTIMLGVTLYIYISSQPSSVSIMLANAALTNDPKPYGITMEQWSIRWWQWAASIEEDENPIEQVSGSYLQKYQPDYPVYFLTGGYNKAVNRTITVPTDKGLFFPIFNGQYFCCYDSQTRPSAAEEQKLKDFTYKETLGSYIVNAELDGVKLPYYRVKSGLFVQELPQDNIHEIKFTKEKTTVWTIADGYYVYLEPLSPGVHKIHLKGQAHDYFTEVYYTIIVMEVKK